MYYYVKLADNRWLGKGFKSTSLDAPDMMEYRRLHAALAALWKATDYGMATDAACVCTIDWSKPHCPYTELKL